MLGMNCVNGFGDGYGVQLTRPSMVTDGMIPVNGDAVCETIVIPPPPLNLRSSSGFPPPRKRCRENVIPDNGGLLSFLGEDLSLIFQIQEVEINRLIAYHTEKMRVGLEARCRRLSRRITTAVEDTIMKKMKDKDEEIEKLGKLKWDLEERLKSLSFENQFWKEMASTSEATANALRCNLQQIFEQIQNDKRRNQNDVAVSSYSSSSAVNPSPERKNHRLCRSCYNDESSVILLPCRHLSLCTVCAASRDKCPVCNAVKTSTVCLNPYGV